MDLLVKKIAFSKIGNRSVVVLPVSVWETVCSKIALLEEYTAMTHSKTYKKDIVAARKSKKEIDSKDLYKKLKLI